MARALSPFVNTPQPDTAGTMREKLVCYLLGELDGPEREQIEARLASEAALRAELEQIRSCLEADDLDPECPEGLASRTVDSIAKLSGDGLLDRCDAPCARGHWTMVDVGVAAGMLLAVGMMVLPALPQTRATSRKIQCEENMRQLGQALLGYSEDHGGDFPFIYPDENAGMFAVRLVESGQMTPQELSRLLRCRASGLQDGSTKLTIRVPRSQELREAQGQALAMLRRWMAGSYAYRLGYVRPNAENGQAEYLPFENHTSAMSPVLCDAPMLIDGQWTGVNHGKLGQNVLHQDGHVRFQWGRSCPSVDGNVFVNLAGRTAAGQAANDFVLVRSDLTPGVPITIKVVAPEVLRPRHPPTQPISAAP